MKQKSTTRSWFVWTISQADPGWKARFFCTTSLLTTSVLEITSLTASHAGSLSATSRRLHLHRRCPHTLFLRVRSQRCAKRLSWAIVVMDLWVWPPLLKMGWGKTLWEYDFVCKGNIVRVPCIFYVCWSLVCACVCWSLVCVCVCMLCVCTQYISIENPQYVHMYNLHSYIHVGERLEHNMQRGAQLEHNMKREHSSL